jgi:hypothetical protein
MNHRKGLFGLVLASVAIIALAISPPVSAQETYFSGVGTAVSTNESFVVLKASGDQGGQGVPRVEYLNATADTATGELVFWEAGDPVELTASSSGTTNILRCVGTTFVTNSLIILRHLATDTYERLLVMTNSATSVTLTNATAAAVAKGDLVYLLTPGPRLPVGNATKEYAPANPLYSGNEARPTLIRLLGLGTNTVRINLVSGRFNRP